MRDANFRRNRCVLHAARLIGQSGTAMALLIGAKCPTVLIRSDREPFYVTRIYELLEILRFIKAWKFSSELVAQAVTSLLSQATMSELIRKML